jgi:hypothetical protein
VLATGEMPNILTPVQSSADVRQNVFTFNSEAAHFYDRVARLLRETTHWVYDPVSESFGPSKFVGFAECRLTGTSEQPLEIRKARALMAP